MEDRPPTEDELVARAKRGELEAYEEIVRRHQSIAFQTAWVITGSAADAEEAAQDAFLKAHAALGRFREGAPFRPGCWRSSRARHATGSSPLAGASGSAA